MWHQNYSRPCTKVIGFVACRVTSKFLGIDTTARSCVDVKTIKYEENMLSAVMYQRNRVVFIHMPVLNEIELNNFILTNNLMKFVQVIPGMEMMILLIKN